MMSENISNKPERNNKQFWHSINIYNNLKRLYFSIIPKGSKVYDFTHSFLNIFLKQLKLFNIYYREWIRRFDTPSMEDIQAIRNHINLMAKKPPISVIMPVYNPPLELLDQAIQSVINQVYPYWELCIADDASTDSSIPSLIQDYIQNDERIKAVFRKENGHISAASNSALELATYDFMALLDHDDILHPLALYYVANEINNHPESVIIYSDEDKITRRGKRLDPYFKPDFDYELLLSQNMVSHLGVYRTSIVRNVGGFRTGLEGSQDYDLVLRVLEHCETDQIHHIPRPLYHWRTIRESAARNLNIKPYAIDAATQALTDHFSRRSINAQVEFLPDLAGYNIFYHLPSPQPSLAIIIPVQKMSESIINLVDEIQHNTVYTNFQIIVGLAESDDYDISTIPEQLQERFLIHRYKNNISYSRLVNQCVSDAATEFICLLDESLTGFQPGWLSILMGQVTQPGIGAVGPKLINSRNNRVVSNGIVFIDEKSPQHLSKGEEKGLNGYFGWAKLTRGYSALSNMCLLFKREHFMFVSGLTETLHIPLNCGIDFCLKLKELGYRNVLRPLVELYIPEYNLSTHGFDIPFHLLDQDRVYLDEHWRKWFLNDPGFNPNLDIIDEKFLINLNPKNSYSRMIT